MKHLRITILAASIYCCIFLPASTALADKVSRENDLGVKSFEEKNYVESEKHFSQALVEAPDSPELKFNLGTSMSAQNRGEDALKQLENAAVDFDDPLKSAAAMFNAGNISLGAGDLDNAISSYTKALKLDQASEDIRYNLEFAMRKKQEQEQEQEEKDQENNEENKENDEQQDGDQKKDSDSKEDNEEQKDKEQEQNSETQNQDDEEQQDQQEQPSQQQQSENQQMTPEEAKRILDALSDEEKKALSLKKMKMKMEMKQGDDW